MEARTESPLHNPLLDLREMEERVRMHEEEDSETQDRIVEEDGEDDAISSTTPDCSRNAALSNQEDNDQQPERTENMQNNEFDEAHAASLENENPSIGIGETNDIWASKLRLSHCYFLARCGLLRTRSRRARRRRCPGSARPCPRNPRCTSARPAA